jgi:hypothetical protein
MRDKISAQGAHDYQRQPSQVIRHIAFHHYLTNIANGSDHPNGHVAKLNEIR